MAKKTNLKIVAIGGGGGTSHILLGARPYFTELSSIISVTDTGRSTGIARDLGKMPAPGDIRNNIANLSVDPESMLAQLLNFRFTTKSIPQLEGMAFGNLMIAAMHQMYGDFGKAVDALQKLVGTFAEIYPVSTEDTQIGAELMDGSLVRGEFEVRGLDKPRIKRLFLQNKNAEAYVPALIKIKGADVVVIGPGSYFTSLQATLLFNGMKEALAQTKAKVVYICNSTTQPGQTDGYTAYDHVKELVDFLGKGVLDCVFVNKTKNLDEELKIHYKENGLHLLEPTTHEILSIKGLVPGTIAHDFVDKSQQKVENWNKLDTIKYNTDLIGKLLGGIARM
jgi:uncharacterized cofD-like protein